jgi:DTW domain-containing protein
VCPPFEPLRTRTRVVFLQHPREARCAIGTARMAHLALADSELHVGVSFDADERVARLLAEPGTALLFPGEGAKAPHELERPPDRLVVLDGTWPQARKLFLANPALHALPRIGFVPEKPGNYRIRREPAEHCLATIEAVAEILSRFEDEPARFAKLLEPFQAMVDRQLAAASARTGAARHRVSRGPWWRSTALPALLSGGRSLVVVQGEANVHRRGSGVEGPPEIVHLVARRLDDGAKFEAFLRPRRPLAPGVPHHLDVPADRLREGEPVAEALARFRAFLRPSDVLCAWGPFTTDLLAAEGERVADPLDVRLLSVARFKRRPGEPMAIARLLGVAPVEVMGGGRAGRTVAVLAAILLALAADVRALPGTEAVDAPSEPLPVTPAR